MTDYNSEQGRELRRARLTRIRPKAAPDMITKRDFTYEYRDFHIVRRELMPDIEERDGFMFCPACQEQEDDELVRARKLHTSYNEDPLRNYRALVTVACKGCGWSEIIPVAAPEALTEEELVTLREKSKYESQEKLDMMRAQMGVYNSALGQSKYANAAAQRQVAKSAMLSAAYGAGPQVMKSLLSGKVGTIHGMSIYEDKLAKPTHGQALADHVWSDYEELDKMRAEAASAKQYVATQKAREEVMREMAEQVAKQVDKDIMSELEKVPAPPIKGHGKGRVTPPPLPQLSAPPTPKELRDAIMAAPPEVRPSLMEKLKGYFR